MNVRRKASAIVRQVSLILQRNYSLSMFDGSANSSKGTRSRHTAQAQSDCICLWRA